MLTINCYYWACVSAIKYWIAVPLIDTKMSQSGDLLQSRVTNQQFFVVTVVKEGFSLDCNIIYSALTITKTVHGGRNQTAVLCQEMQWVRNSFVKLWVEEKSTNHLCNVKRHRHKLTMFSLLTDVFFFKCYFNFIAYAFNQVV